MERPEAGVDAPSFVDVYTASFQRVYTSALAYCGNVDVAEDATQEAFARAYAHWRRIGLESWAVGWIMTTAMNETRRRSRRRRLLSSVEGRITEAPQFLGLELLEALHSLPRRQREVVILYYIHDLPVAAVSNLLGISEGSIKTHLSRARKALRQLIGGHPDD